MNPAPNATALEALIRSFRDFHVWVIGDMMLDEYLIGDIGRISPEAPVPLMRVHETQWRLGGATNVARQISTLGARTSMCGLIGKDSAGDLVIEGCAAAGIKTEAVGRLENQPTTRKVRVLGRGQQLMRLDWEETHPCSIEGFQGLLSRLAEGPAPDAIVLSDYAKGLLNPSTIAEVVRRAREYGVRVLVDPKRRDFTAYRGASVITPNLLEFEAATGRDLLTAGVDAIAELARGLTEELELEAMVVTMGARGMLAVPKSGPFIEVPVQRRAVYDVTGAGDTAVAVMALALAAGGTLEDAVFVSNAASGIAVGEVGAVSVPAAEIIATVTGKHSGKVFSREGIAAQAETWRMQGRSVVFTNGCFDLLHLGHLTVLQEAAALGDVLVLAINSDSSVRRLKGEGRPLVHEDERAALLAALDCVDAVTIFDEDTPLETLEKVLPDVLVKGQDYLLHEVVGRELVESRGGRVELVPLLAEHSTSKLLERIRRGSSS
ncbi:MAG: D-glycero-beta-D-manno-heptose 1-phosphate adenylyltransferase [bacterium]|nr:D-glycero-beta-D-manno-heptose 1-phosphate adenylyltransferase [bacterium]